MKRALLLTVAVFIWMTAISCGSSPNPVGKYRVNVPGEGGKVNDVGQLDLRPDGAFSMSLGQLSMQGKWSRQGDVIKFDSGDAGVQMLNSREFKIEGNRLVPEGDSGPLKHWYIVRE